MIAGLEDISDGTLRIGDRGRQRRRPARRDISMVFQSYALYPHMTVQRNIESPLLARHYHLDGSRQAGAQAHLRRSEPSAWPRRLGCSTSSPTSSASRRSCPAASASAWPWPAPSWAGPRLFLMDEPLSNLDAKLRAQTRIELVELHRRVGTTVVYVTHDQVEAMTMATRVAVMSMGKLQQVGTPQDVYAKPVNTFVAQFIGTPPMNCVDAAITADGTGVDLGAAGRLPLPGRPPGPAGRRRAGGARRPARAPDPRSPGHPHRRRCGRSSGSATSASSPPTSATAS
jgi:multiple sugar transport system ATP-binding protein